MFTFNQNLKLTGQSTPSANTTPQNNQEQSNAVSLIACLEKYKPLIKKFKYNIECDYNNTLDWSLWQKEYKKYKNNVVKAEELKPHSEILNIINKKDENINRYINNITNIIQSSPNVDSFKKSIEVPIKNIKNNCFYRCSVRSTEKSKLYQE